MMPKVSVIIPTYNRKDIVLRAIKSVLDQTFGDYEIIIIDDGSTDGSEKLLKKLFDRHPQVAYYRQKNKGPGGARNMGITKSKSEYLAFLDSDNAWHPDFLKVMVGELEEQRDFVMAYSSQNLFLVSPEKEGKEKIIARKVRSFKYNPVELLRTNYIDVNAVVLRRSLINEVGNFDESLSGLEDWDLFVRIAIKYPFRIKQVDQVLGDYYYSESFDTITNKIMPKSAVRIYMGMSSTDEATKKVVRNIRRYLSKEKK